MWFLMGATSCHVVCSRRSQRPVISPPIELEISAPAACMFHHPTCRHFQRCEPTDITGRNLPMMAIPLSLDAHQCALVACAWRVANAKRRQRADHFVADTTAKQLRYLPAQMENFLGSYNSAAFIV